MDWFGGGCRCSSSLGIEESARIFTDLLVAHRLICFVFQTLSGLIPSKVDSLALTLKHPVELQGDDIPSIFDLRLFSTGGGSELAEWDMVHATIRVT